MAAPTDDEAIAISVTINKTYHATSDIESSKDITKSVEISKADISVQQLRKDIVSAFEKPRTIKSLFDEGYLEWSIFLYDPDKADTELNEDNLKSQIEEFCKSQDKHFKIRVVFYKSMLCDLSLSQRIKYVYSICGLYVIYSQQTMLTTARWTSIAR